MSKRTKIILGISGGGMLVLVFAVTVAVVFGDRAVRRARKIQSQLTSNTDLSNSQRTKLVDQLIREVDQMDRDQLRQLWRESWNRQRELTQKSVREYLAAAPAEQMVVLDRDLDRMQEWREISFAMRPDSMFRTRGGPRRDRNRDNANPDRRRDNNPRGGRGGPDRDRNQMTDEQRQDYAAYYQALRKRAAERGIEMRGSRNRRS